MIAARFALTEIDEPPPAECPLQHYATDAQKVLMGSYLYGTMMLCKDKYQPAIIVAGRKSGG
jgi:hypothetical protein